MQPDTRKLLRSGIAILCTGLLAVAGMFTVFGGVSRMGPHTNSGWLALVLAMGCLPTGTLTMVLALMKLFSDRRR